MRPVHLLQVDIGSLSGTKYLVEGAKTQARYREPIAPSPLLVTDQSAMTEKKKEVPLFNNFQEHAIT